MAALAWKKYRVFRMTSRNTVTKQGVYYFIRRDTVLVGSRDVQKRRILAQGSLDAANLPCLTPRRGGGLEHSSENRGVFFC